MKEGFDMDDLPIGSILTMTVTRKLDTGYVLDNNMRTALLHHNEADETLEVGQDVRVFLYKDKKDNTTATMQLPEITLDTYGWSKVIDVKLDLGVFVDIGTSKEMLVSKDDLPIFTNLWPQNGDMLYVTLGKDRKGRLLAIPASENVINDKREWAPDEYLNKEIRGWIYRTDREGAALITDEFFRGFIHHTERKEEPRLGALVEGRVIDVKSDGTLNISLRPWKKVSMHEDAKAILTHLEQHGGVIPFSDKSTPEDIRGTFQISKAAFKRALGMLMKEGRVKQENGKTFLIP